MPLYSPLISQFMLSQPLVVDPDLLMSELIALLQQTGQSRAIVAKDRTPKGIITEKAIIAALMADESSQASATKAARVTEGRVSDVMSSAITVVQKHQSLRDLQTAVLYVTQSHVVVVNNKNQVCGAIYPEQLVAVYAHLLETQASRLNHSLKQQVNTLTDENRRLMRQMLEDSLLKISNRRAFEKEIGTMHAQCRRYDRQYSILLIDLDNFRSFNDSNGHTKGDQLLIRACQFLQKSTRLSDRLYRYGGSQFAFLLPETDDQCAATLGHRLLEKWQNEACQLFLTGQQKLTLSIGIKCLQAEDLESSEWSTALGQADLALHISKQQGNQVICFKEVIDQARFA